MKKVLFLQIASSAAFLGAFYGCSGGSNNPPPFNNQAGSVAVLNVNQICTGTGINLEVCSQNYTLTSNKQAEFQDNCIRPNGETSQNCRVSIKGAEAFSVDLPDQVESNITPSDLPILNPGSQTGGISTGIMVFPGDLLTVRMAGGHYSPHAAPSPNGGCANEIGVDGNQQVDGQDAVIKNSQNGYHAGAYLEFVDASGARSGFQAVGRTSVKIQVPQTGGQNAPLSVLIGYNAQSMSCGDIKLSYQITRCLDTSLNTYDCSKL